VVAFVFAWGWVVWGGGRDGPPPLVAQKKPSFFGL
jgi:hypothetical protein